MRYIFFVVLVDLIGFGIMIPIFAYYVLQLGGGPEQATILMALYPLAMFISSPWLGRLSDYYGRKPILIVSMAGACIGYLILAFAESLWLIAISRLLSGFMAGNIATAQAYIVDITDKNNRAKGMGLIGAALGLGFVIGAAVGSVMAGGNFETANFLYPALTSAALSLVSLCTIMFFLKESLSKSTQLKLRQQPRDEQLSAIKKVLARPVVALIVLCGILLNLAAGLFESIFPIWIKDLALIDGPNDLVAFLLTGGLTLVIVQGGLVGKLANHFGEHKLLRYGALGYAIAMILMIFFALNHSYWGILLTMMIQAGTTGLMTTSCQSLVSLRAGDHEKGLVMGVYSSLGTLARSVATLATGSIYIGFGSQSPLLLAAMCTAGLAVAAVTVQRRWTGVTYAQ
ncbi:MFS transporter [Thalassotalea mangrovi]|uniref:MFS transporter n=1 Tax=Thalassotalea mangrovi TaxID=2572245 RepID=A0A4U1B6I2_9GAMM|nr:MFS transporter [Thalassotalea mangrovi]TKB46058.1 MFS transporter [Thalassotalea mangrovi]